MRRRKSLAVLASAGILLLAAAGCSGSDSSGTNTAPIKVGAISSLSGPVVFPEASQAVKAVFDKVNREGGINGRQIDYLVEDDKVDPQAAQQAARKLVDSDEVVAMVGSASALECSVNGALYKQKKVMSVQGTGVDPACFSSSNISPVNTGPFQGITVSLQFASETLKHDKVCAVLVDYAGWGDAYAAAIAQWEKATGKKLALLDATYKPGPEDPTPFVLKVKAAGCQAVVFDGVDVAGVAWMQAVKAQKVTGIDWVFLTSNYTDKVAQTLGADGEGLYANSEFEPFGGSSTALADWKQTMTAAGVPLNSFAQGGYLAATDFVQAVRGIKGEINRESVSAALSTLTSVANPMVGTPYSFAPADKHNSNRASKFVQLKGGAWVTVTPDWIILPEAN
jgi:branched-chain amino acid transport system substrate-binding protein